MFVQVVTYSLEGISEDAYLDVATGVAPRYASLPGLLAKIWLENPGGNRYGAVYFWEDVESMERFGESDLFEDDTPEFVEFVSEEFKVLENLTAQTQPVLQILEPRTSSARVAAPPTQAPAPTVAPATAGGVKRTPPPRRSATASKSAPAKKAAPPTTKAAGGSKMAAPTAKASGARKAAATGKTAAGKTAPVKKAPAKKAGRKAVR